MDDHVKTAVRFTSTEFSIKRDFEQAIWRKILAVKKSTLDDLADDTVGGFLDPIVLGDLVPEIESFGFSTRDIFWIMLEKRLNYFNIDVESGYFPLDDAFAMTVAEMSAYISDSIV